MTDSGRCSWTVLLPVKVLARAKSRLAVLAGDRRGELALAFASDTVAAVARCPQVARVIVVTSDPAAGPLLAALGAIIVTDSPADRQAGRGHRPAATSRTRDQDIQELSGQGDGAQDALNAALRHGAAVAASRWPGTGLAALTADLPALDPAELSAALLAAGSIPGRTAFVPDAAGVGTTLYAVAPGGEFRPLFGGASRARHAASGATELDFDVMAGLRRDVDTPEDLRTALTLGVGPRTRAAAAQLRPQASR
jgi:2-phospho-L-lactate/phosphoenolpyruvate guanylyltransferase